MATSVKSGPARSDDCPVRVALGDASVREYLDRIARRMLRAGGNAMPHASLVAEAEELTSRAIERALAKSEQYDPLRGEPRIWIGGFIRTIARERKKKTDSVRGIGGEHDLFGRLEAREDCSFDSSTARKHLERAVESLTEREQLLFREYQNSGMSNDGLAKHLNLKPVAVRVALCRVRKKLKSLLSHLVEGQP